MQDNVDGYATDQNIDKFDSEYQRGYKDGQKEKAPQSITINYLNGWYLGLPKY